LESFCAAHGIAEGDLLQTIFGLLLATNGGHRQVEVVTACPEWFGRITVETLSLTPANSLREIVGEWSTKVFAGGEGESFLADMDAFLNALELPAFEYAPSGAEARARIKTALFPVACTITRTQGTLELALQARDDHLPFDELAVFAHQFELLVAAMLDRPGATLEELVRLLPPLRFEITLASNFGLETLTPVLEFWGAEIGLPVSVKALQLGEIAYRERVPEFPPPPGIGATVLLTRPDEWEAGRCYTRELRPVNTPPPGQVLGGLPNGAAVGEKNRNETREVYEEVFGRRVYLRGGLRIVDGATVIDVGANIGLFTLFAHHEASGVTVHAFEPASELVDLLRVNARLYGVDAVIHHGALGAEARVAEFTYYPRSTLQSGFHTDTPADEDVVRQYARGQTTAVAQEPLGAHVLDADLSEGIDALMSERFVSERQRVCVRTLSDVIEEYDIHRIDFLKIDVERAEQDVLDGIRPHHWPYIQQIAIEVHDIGGRVGQVSAFLQEQGFLVVVEQAHRFKDTELFMLYARRPEYLRQEDAEAAASHHAAFLAAAAAWGEYQRDQVYVVVGPAADCGVREGAPGELRAQLAEIPGITFLDLTESAGDFETVSSSGLGYSPEVSAALGTVIFRRITAVVRKPTKAIVVDADNVLWGGVCGEVGPANVIINQAYRGVQDFLAAQKASGRLLCLCSKNNFADVKEVWEGHPEMRLALSDFAAIRINWESKAENLLEMSREIGVALESIVFIDDSPTERAEVAIRLPDVTVVALPEDPAQFVDCLRGTWALDIDALSAEDRLRNEFGKSARDRRALARTAATFRDYLQKLGLKIRIENSQPEEVPRITQLARRTTQFNLTLNRLSTGDIRRLMATSTVTLSVHVEDRFGHYGLVGFLAGTRDGNCLDLSDLFLSCRALGRNVEWAMLRELGRRALSAGMECVRLRACRGERNQPALSFLRYVASGCDAPLDSARLNVTVPALALASLDWQGVTLSLSATAPPQAPDDPRVSAATIRYRWPVAATPPGIAQRLHRVNRHRPNLSTPYVLPRTKTEAKIARIWYDLLGIEQLGIHDDLIACGGDSLTAVAICAQVRRALGVEVMLDDFLARPTISCLADQVSAVRQSPDPSAARPNGRAPARALGALEATDGQRRVWAADRTSRVRNSQIIPLSYQIEGLIDETRLETAFATVITQNAALHTIFIPTDGKLLPGTSESRFELRRATLEGASPAEQDARVRELGEAFFAEPFDLSKDLMLRALLIRLSPSRHVLLVAVHHVSADGWSIGLLQRQVGEAYEDPLHPTRRHQYREYAQWVREQEARGYFDEGLRSIRSRLLPAERTSAMRGDFERGTRHATPRFTRFEIQPETNSEVQKFARRIGATPASVFLAAFQLYLAAHNRRDHSTVGYLVANRVEPEFQEIIGFLANIVPILMDVDWSESIPEYVNRSGRETFRMLGHSAVPYGLLLRDLLGDPYRFDRIPFEALFTYQSTPSHPLRLGGCHISVLEPVWWPVPFEFMLDIEERSDKVTALLRWDGGRFEATSVEAFVTAYPILLQLCCKLADAPLSVLQEVVQKIASQSVESPAGKEVRSDSGWLFGPTVEPSSEDLMSVVERFASAAPDAIAVRDDQSSLSYAQLLTVSRQIDAELAGAGVEPGDGVIICMFRRPLLLAALLGVMRRGAYFVPRDPGDPPARLDAIIADAAPRAMLADDDTIGLLSGRHRTILHIHRGILDSDATASARRETRSPQELAYLLYTSGSTGLPKGVEVTRRSLMNYLEWASDAYEVASGSGSLVHSSIAVDLTLTSMFVPLLAGRPVSMVASDDPEVLAKTLREAVGLSFLKLTPGGLNLLQHLLTAAEMARATRHLVLGGEQLTAAALKWLADGAKGLAVTNEYGPTETTVGSCAFTFRVGEPVADPVPIGRPIRNTSIALLSPSAAPCTRGAIGEIVIGGLGVANGYRERLQETALRFRPDPSGKPGSRCYHTGDLGHLTDDGLLVYKGRTDDQVKIHGYRVETAEVEAVLCHFPGITAAAVVPVTHPSTNATHLSAFVVADGQASQDLSTELHEWVREQLPMHARLDQIEVVEHLPLAPSGKVDRKALVERVKAPGDSARALVGAPSDKLDVIARIWQGLLGHSTPTSNDNFFAMGGDSIKALHLVTAAREAGFNLTIHDVLAGRTLGRIVAAAKPLESAARPVVLAAGDIPLTPNQAAFFSIAPTEPDRWSLRWMFTAPTMLDPRRLAAALRVVRHKHPALRCQFVKSGGEWSAQLFAEAPSLLPEVIVVRSLNDETTARLIAEHLSRVEGRLRLATGGTVELCVFDLGPERETILAWVAHHLVTDIVSLQIMSRDLLAAYDAGTKLDQSAQDDGYTEWARRAAQQNTLVFPGGTRSPECAQFQQEYDAVAFGAVTRSDAARHHRPTVILLAALMRALSQVFRELPTRVCVENNGRARPDLGMEVPSAVGWFTTYRIFQVDQPDEYSDAALVDLLHRRMVEGEVPMRRTVLPDVALNYLGSIGLGHERYLPAQLADAEGVVSGTSLIFGLELNCWVEGQRLLSNWRFDPAHFPAGAVRQLSDRFGTALSHLVAASESDGDDPRPWDFADADLSEEDLARILNDWSRS
jgi:amino acid adenylation domain-containing protein/FkbH-like protein/FkbM family methyltransferase